MAYKNPKLTVDGIIIKEQKILLVKRRNEPFKGKWALPGGYVEYGEEVENAIIREINEETSLKVKIKDLVGVYSNPYRDPRGHSVTIVFSVEVLSGVLKSGDDASDAKFFNLDNVPDLSFDHNKIIKDFIRRQN